MTLDPSQLTEKQLLAYKDFKENCKDVIPRDAEDSELLKWMKARNYNAKQAESMYRKNIQWRKRIDADNLIDKWDPPEVLKLYYPGGLWPGEDKEGHPIWIDLSSYFDFKGLLYSTKKSDIVKFEARQLEIGRKAMSEQSKKHGRKIDQLVVIMDMAKLGMKHLWSPGLRLYNEIIGMTEDNYPENLHSLYIINAPRLFPIAFNIVKPLLTEETRRKIHILGSNWRTKIQDAIDPDQLPKQWGGNCTDPDGDPYCKSRINIGGEVPKSFYANANEIKNNTYSNTKVVDRGSCHQVRLDVHLAHSAIKWDFQSQDSDIGFGIMRLTDPKKQKISEMEEIVPIQKVNSHMVAEDGIIECPEPGIYVVAFDNRYSWIYSKTVSFNLEIIKPGAVDELNNVVNKNSEIPIDTITEVMESTKM